MMVDAQENTSSWLLRGSTLTAVEQVLRRLNLEERARLRGRWEADQRRRPLADLPPLISGALPHPEYPLPRVFQPTRGRPRRTSANPIDPTPIPAPVPDSDQEEPGPANGP